LPSTLVQCFPLSDEEGAETVQPPTGTN